MSDTRSGCDAALPGGDSAESFGSGVLCSVSLVVSPLSRVGNGTGEMVVLIRVVGGSVLATKTGGFECFSGHVCAGLRSQHAGGGQFLLCDGFVRFISENIDFNNAGARERNDQGIAWPGDLTSAIGIYQRLGMRNDDQVLGEF